MRHHIAGTAIERAIRREAAVVRLKLTSGLPRLAMVPVTVASAGALGAILGIVGAFRFCGVSEGTRYETVVAAGLAEAFVPAALGLMLAAPAWIGNRYFRNRLDQLSSELNIACFDITAAWPLSGQLAALGTTAIDAAERAAMRRAGMLRLEHTRGLGILAAIPPTALFAGLLLTIFGVMNSFKEFSGSSRWNELVAMLTLSIAGALHWLLAGLAVAIAAWSGRRYLLGEVEALDDQMSVAAKDLAIALQRLKAPITHR